MQPAKNGFGWKGRQARSWYNIDNQQRRITDHIGWLVDGCFIFCFTPRTSHKRHRCHGSDSEGGTALGKYLVGNVPPMGRGSVRHQLQLWFNCDLTLSTDDH